MVIEYKINSTNKDELELCDEFAKYLVHNIREEIYNNVIPDKFRLLEKDILNATWIKWNDKPSSINMMKLVRFIISRIGVTKRRDTYVIGISQKHLLPRSNTKLEAVARFLDMGNNVSPSTTFISRILNKYRSNINDYWEAFVSYKLGKYNVSEVVIIR